MFSDTFLTNPGYVRFTNGLIIQWGTSSVKNNTAYTIEFPVPFKSSIFAVTVTARTNQTGGAGAWTPKIWTTTNLTHLVVSVDAGSCMWIAIGI